MTEHKKPSVFVIIPAYNEETRISKTIQRIPRNVVDKIIVIDDASNDGTAREAQESGADILIRHYRNKGCGASVKTGYKEALRRGADIIVIVSGDNQAPCEDITKLLQPIFIGQADHVLGDRQLDTDIPRKSGMPWIRQRGLQLLSWLTSKVSGIEVKDSQVGITAITAEALKKINLELLSDRWGYNNDLILESALKEIRMKWVPVNWNYKISRKSYIKLLPYALRVSSILFRGFLRKLYFYYALWVFSFTGMILILMSVVLGIWIIYESVVLHIFRVRSVVAAFGLLLTGLFLTLFGFLIDIIKSLFPRT